MEGALVKLKDCPARYAGRIRDGYKFVLYLFSADNEPQGQRYFKSEGVARRYVNDTGIRL